MDKGSVVTKVSVSWVELLSTIRFMSVNGPSELNHVHVKAAGGVRDLDTLRKVQRLGVTRCGTSRTKELLDPLREQLGLPVIESVVPQVDANPNY